jgi:uncharacterized lipoprotein NlpE involved in copper resistance
MKNLIKYFLVVFTFYGCNNVKKNDNKIVSTVVLDTLKMIPAQIFAQPILLENAFINGTTEKVKDATFNLYGLQLEN